MSQSTTLYSGAEIDVGQAYSLISERLSDLSARLLISRNSSPGVINFEIIDPDSGNISQLGFKVEVMISGSNGFVSLYESGSVDVSGVEKGESAEDIKAGWSKYIDIITDYDTLEPEIKWEAKYSREIKKEETLTLTASRPSRLPSLFLQGRAIPRTDELI